MGIRGLWDILGEGRITSLARLASDHFQRTREPLRIAVDEVNWRFNNLTAQQVAIIRRSEPRANPIEKAILFRILRLQRLNIHLLFVFDGPSRPWKRNRPGGRVDYEHTSLLRKVLDRLAVPQHFAPGEAEAECAKLQSEGVVDAVWSDDGDALMFGCGLLIRDHRVSGSGKTALKKSDSHVRVYTAEDIHRRLRLDRAGLVLFAVLSGGDYDTQGLKGCGPQLAWRLAKSGLGQTLSSVSQRDLPRFSAQLQDALRAAKSPVDVPPDFPLYRAVEHYRNPKVSDLYQLHNLRDLQHGWDREIDQEKLRPFLTEKFNLWTKGFLKHVAPALLVRRLLLTGASKDTSVQNRDNSNPYGIAVMPRRTRATQANDDKDNPAEMKITFDPTSVVSFDLTIEPPTESWSEFKTKDGEPYDPTQPVECEIPESILRYALPSDILQMPTPAKKPRGTKRNATDNAVPAIEKKTCLPIEITDDENVTAFENDSLSLTDQSILSATVLSTSQLATITAKKLSKEIQHTSTARVKSLDSTKTSSARAPTKGIQVIDLTLC